MKCNGKLLALLWGGIVASGESSLGWECTRSRPLEVYLLHPWVKYGASLDEFRNMIHDVSQGLKAQYSNVHVGLGMVGGKSSHSENSCFQQVRPVSDDIVSLQRYVSTFIPKLELTTANNNGFEMLAYSAAGAAGFSAQNSKPGAIRILVYFTDDQSRYSTSLNGTQFNPKHLDCRKTDDYPTLASVSKTLHAADAHPLVLVEGSNPTAFTFWEEHVFDWLGYDHQTAYVRHWDRKTQAMVDVVLTHVNDLECDIERVIPATGRIATFSATTGSPLSSSTTAKAENSNKMRGVAVASAVGGVAVLGALGLLLGGARAARAPATETTNVDEGGEDNPVRSLVLRSP